MLHKRLFFPFHQVLFIHRNKWYTHAALDMHYPEELPICTHRGDILAALRAHPVVVVCGDTGSGKTTQLPKMALELGLAAKGRRIGCTQPRRLAAVTMAERVASELQTPVGGLVGYQHRRAPIRSCAPTTASSSTRPTNVPSTSTSSSASSSASSRAAAT